MRVSRECDILQLTSRRGRVALMQKGWIVESRSLKKSITGKHQQTDPERSHIMICGSSLKEDPCRESLQVPKLSPELKWNLYNSMILFNYRKLFFLKGKKNQIFLFSKVDAYVYKLLWSFNSAVRLYFLRLIARKNCACVLIAILQNAPTAVRSTKYGEEL